MKQLLTITRFIMRHPLASKNKLYSLGRFFRWQLGQYLMKRPVLYPLVENSSLLIEKGMTGATGNIYTGLLEFSEMAFVLHVLRDEDLFGDIGANVGVYSILASANAGSSVMAAEPVPATFEKLQRNVYLNGVSGKVRMLQAGIGSSRGELVFSAKLDTVNHVLKNPDQYDNNEKVQVPVYTLNELCGDQIPVLLKIDVEGFEWEVLNGASGLLASQTLKSIIIELNGSGKRYGYDDEKIHALLTDHGFLPYTYDPFQRKAERLEKYGEYNTIYIRDLPWIKNRFETARKFRVLKSAI